MFQLPLVARNQVFCYNKARKNVKEVVPVKLNEKILYYRKAARLSQEELAARVGVSRQAVSKWELGDATPEVDKLLALAKVFGVTTDELLSEAEPAKVQGEAPPQGQPAAHT
ncbi:MAG: helix-turn-helix domain-containing protein, partial [Oscillospiraceae bacterium]